MIVGFDCSSAKAGWCSLNAEGLPIAGSLGGMRIDKSHLAASIRQAVWAVEAHVNSIWVLARSLELPRGEMQAHTVSLLNTVEGMVRMAIFERTGLEPVLVNERSMRSLVGYRRPPPNSPKSAVKAAVRRCFELANPGHPILTTKPVWLDDILDAWAIARGYWTALRDAQRGLF